MKRHFLFPFSAKILRYLPVIIAVYFILGTDILPNVCAQSATYDKYYDTYIDDWKDSSNELQLPSKREELIKKLETDQKIDAAKSKKLLDEKLFPAFRSIIGKQENSPVLQYNTLLLITRFEQEPKVPYAPATDLLLTVMKSSRVSEYLKIGALQGLNSHILRIPDSKKKEIEPIFRQYAFTDWKKDELAGTTWMRELALKGIGLLKNPGNKGENVDALMKIITSKDYPMETRMIAAVAMSRLTVTQQTLGKQKAYDIYNGMTNLAVEALTREFQHPVIFSDVLPGMSSSQLQMEESLEVSPTDKEKNLLANRSVRQRVKSVASPLYEALNLPQDHSLVKLFSNSERAEYQKIVRTLGAIRRKYDKTNTEDPYTKLLLDFYDELKTLYETVGLDYKILAKRRTEIRRLHPKEQK
ncbi:MAG: hypothetical protein Q4C96_07655 [Planctomycetia bacterium]|nr:hypothetical protein [Planctomycetia bacterium]